MDNDYELLYLAKENDEDATEVLIKKYKKVINYKVSKYSKGLEEYKDDFYNESISTLYKSIYSYKDDYAFSTFYNACLENSLKSYRLFLLNKIPLYSKDLMDAKEKNSNPEKMLLDEYNYDEFRKKITNTLNWREELVFALKEQNYTAKEISEITDSNLKTIYTIISRTKDKISKIMSNEYN